MKPNHLTDPLARRKGALIARVPRHLEEVTRNVSVWRTRHAEATCPVAV